VVASTALLATLIPASAGITSAAVAYTPPASRTVMFAADGMRPDLVDKYSAEGLMPTMAALKSRGVSGDNGMLQAFPPNTGVGWYTMATGAYPAEHGSTNNTFHRTGDVFSNRTSFAGANVLQADTIAQAAERAGRKVAQVNWVGGRSAAIAGPTVDFTNFFSGRGVLVGQSDPDEVAGAATFGVVYQVEGFDPASGWTNVPTGDPVAPPMQNTLTIATTFAAQNPTRVYDLYAYDDDTNGTVDYDTVLLVPSAAAKDGSQAEVNLVEGDFEEVKLTGADGLIGTRAGQAAGFYTKLISLAPDLSNFKLYFTSVQRVIASCSTAACAALPAGGAGEDRLEKYLAENVPTYIAADFAPLEARVVDEETYVEQGLRLHEAYADATLDFVLGELQPDTELAMVGLPITDEFSHQFMGLYTPTDMDGDPNPYYDDVEDDDVPDGRTAIREGFVRSAYHAADEALTRARSLMGPNPTTFVGADHGFAPAWLAVNARKVLFDTMVMNTQSNSMQSVHPSGGAVTSNCGATVLTTIGAAPNNNYVSGDVAKACWAGGTIQIYINNNLPNGVTYNAVRAAVKASFGSLADPDDPGKQIVDRILDKEQLRDVDGSDSLHPNRSGDVVVVLRPPYQSDAGKPGIAIAPSDFFGQHGFAPDLVDLAHNVNLHATFIMSGPGIRTAATPLQGLRAVDVAPTISFLMGFPGPQNARGRILFDVMPNRTSLREVTILNISDWHGQLPPLSDSPDNISGTGTANPSFSIGGAAYLKPWFDTYRSEARNGSVTLMGGDSIGATPPISNSFEDRPAIEAMNLMGVDVDGIGNHNFDAGQIHFRKEIVPLANFPFLSSNVVNGNTGNFPKQWRAATAFDFGGARIGFIGFTNEDLPELTSPAKVAPFVVTDAATAVNKYAKQLAPTTDGLVAFGHLGATGGTITTPTGPLLNLANASRQVDVVMGDHTDFQVLAVTGNRVLVTENRSRGLRFTRVRMVVDLSRHKTIYRTADWHKPWNVGVAADPQIQARIDFYNAQLAPIFNTVVGHSTVAIPHADKCGGFNSRSCESLLGNTVTDAMRETYAASVGVEFAITNSGGLRAALTCPTTDNPSDFCPPFTPPPYPITRGQVNTVLPFGNVVATLDVNGAELKTMLENGVSLTGLQGRFPQVSGLCFTYDINNAVNNRVVSAVRQTVTGCDGTPIDLTAASTYTIAENDFMLGGGDGYPDFRAGHGAATQGIMDQVLADWISAETPISPTIQGRIRCIDSLVGTAPECPAGSNTP
jgi:2',3'-cyclic-nucleotide 2'-phosphodiesterase (5'-nucleotidase family)/predicted AlkP superfamily phosphohydrolase/phosphomutase